MKILLCLSLLLVFDLSQASEDDWLYVPYNLYSGHNYNNRPDHHNRDHHDRHDSQDYIYRPCSIRDLNCIQRYLLQNSICTPTYEPRSDYYFIKKLSMDVPHANVTITVNNVKLNGLRTGRVEELYINKKTDTLVLEVEFQELTVDSPKSDIVYHQKGKEPVETTDASIIIFKKLSLTLVIRYFHDASQTESHVYAYISDSRPVLKLGAGLEENQGVGANLIWRDSLALTVQEAMVNQAPVYLDAYLKWICNLKDH